MSEAKIQQEYRSEKDLISIYDCEDQVVLTDTIGESKGRNSSRRRRRMLCFNISVCFQLLILAITALFCLWLYTRVQHLKTQLEKLKNEPKYQNQASSAEARFAVGICNHSNAYDYHSSLEEMMQAHHGIPNSEIAHIFGDEGTLQSYKYKVPIGGDPNLKFNRQTSSFPEFLSPVYLNSRSDYWNQATKRFAINRSHGMENPFRYFKKGKWMFASSSNYVVEDNYKIKAKKGGMYQIYAHIQFLMHPGSATEGSMRVIKQKVDRTHSILGQCKVDSPTIPGNQGEQSYHCSVYQVSIMKPGDYIFMDIEAFVFFSIDPDQLHLTVIRLNDEGQQDGMTTSPTPNGQ